MEVTRNNFKKCLPMIENSITTADFLAIDTELTGLTNGRNISIFDSPREYYMTLLTDSSEFLLIQFGLCTFHWNEEKQLYMNESYNFYLFPRGRPGTERMFLCQSSSIEFLASQGFDFNKLIREGISYMTEAVETRLRENLVERQKTFDHKENIPIPEENREQIEEICKKVKHFLDDTSTEEMEIDCCNSFVRRLLFQELGNRFKSKVFLETKILDNMNRVLRVIKKSAVIDSKSKDILKKEKEWEDFDEAVGFSKVARMISHSRKLVVGHNMLLDVLHTVSHFFQALPTDYADFKELTHCMFPKLLDTKYMSSLPPFKEKVNSSVLPHLFATLSEEPFNIPEAGCIEGHGYNRADNKQHEAGFDAYITGLCFLSMQAYLAGMRGEPNCRISTAESPALKPFINKIFLARTAHQDSPYLNLAGEDPTPSRDHVFYLKFPKEWQRNDIYQLFSPFGPVLVQFVDETSALVALLRREHCREVLSLLKTTSQFSLVPFVKYKEALLKVRQTDKQPHKKTSDDPNSTYLGRAPDATQQSWRDTASYTAPTNEISMKIDRRSNSALVAAVPKQTSRKRTSSGVFQVDKAEPPNKKSESGSDSNAGSTVCSKHVTVPDLSSTPVTPERRSSASESTTDEKNPLSSAKAKKKIIERFQSSVAQSKCVNAFRESDSWE